MNKNILILALLMLAGTGIAAEGDGGYAGAFLQVPIGARPTAMGGAYLALSNDAAGALFNPAGLANISTKVVGFSYRAMQLDRTLGYATFMMPIQGRAALGVSWLYAGSGSVEARDRNGRPLDYDVSFNNNAISLLFAKRFEDYFSAGAKLTYYQADIAEMTTSSMGIDFGATLYLSQFASRETRDQKAVQDIRLSGVVRNVAAKFNWNSADYLASRSIAGLGAVQEDKIPIEVGLGGSARFLNRKLVLATDVLMNIEQTPRLHIGVEYFLAPDFALRTGFSDGRLTAGTGYEIKVGGILTAIDYAFSTDRADEGSEHIFSFDLMF